MAPSRLVTPIADNADAWHKLTQTVEILDIAGQHAGTDHPRLRIGKGVIEEPTLMPLASGQGTAADQFSGEDACPPPCLVHANTVLECPRWLRSQRAQPLLSKC